MADWLMQVVDEEDYQVGLQVQRGLQSGHLADVIFGRNESGNQYAHRCIQYYAEGAEGRCPVFRPSTDAGAGGAKSPHARASDLNHQFALVFAFEQQVVGVKTVLETLDNVFFELQLPGL